MSGTRIDEICDAVAVIAAGKGHAPWVCSSIWGAGSGLIDDPLRPGQKVQPGFPLAPADYSFYVMPPTNSRPWEYGDATSAMVNWTIEGRLYVPRGELANAARILVGFVNPFAKAFTATSTESPTLSDTCANSQVSTVSFAGEADAGTAWLSLRLAVTEIVNLND